MTRKGTAPWIAVLCAMAILPIGYSQELRTLKVSVLEGDGGFNDIVRRTAHDIVIEVLNERGQPVPDAKVVFSAPVNGASVLFADGSKTYITNTDALGRASARGLKPTAAEGRFTIQVTASASGQQVGTGAIVQSNTLASGKPASTGGNGKKILIMVLLAGAGAGLGLGLRGKGGTPAPVAVPPTILTVGSVSVGGPR